MAKPIAIFYHCLFGIGEPFVLLPQAGCIVSNQMTDLINSGLWDAASEIHIGVNGGAESVPIAKHIIPPKAKITYHGLVSRAENLTLCMLHEFSKTYPGWNILYFHSKCASHPPNSDYAIAWPLRGECDATRFGVRTGVPVWPTLMPVTMLPAWYSFGSKGGINLNTSSGNFWWATSDFIAPLPSMYLRERIKQDGISALSSRFEAEVFIANGDRRPTVKAYRDRLPF